MVRQWNCRMDLRPPTATLHRGCVKCDTPLPCGENLKLKPSFVPAAERWFSTKRYHAFPHGFEPSQRKFRKSRPTRRTRRTDCTTHCMCHLWENCDKQFVWRSRIVSIGAIIFNLKKTKTSPDVSHMSRKCLIITIFKTVIISFAQIFFILSHRFPSR